MQNHTLKKSVMAAVLATTLLTSTNVSYASSSLQGMVDQARKDMKEAAYSYVVPSQNGKLVPSSDLYPTLNKVKKDYQKAKDAITKSNVKNKTTLLNDLNDLYNERITKGLIPYIDAYNYADKYLNPILADIQKAEQAKDWEQVEKQYHKLSVQLKSRSAIMYRFTGKAARDLLLEQYKHTADMKRTQLMVPVTIYMKVKQTDKLLAEGKQAEAKTVLESIKPLQLRLPSASALPMVKELLEEVSTVFKKAGMNTTPPPTPTTPTTPSNPSTGGGSNGGNSGGGNTGGGNTGGGNDGGNNGGGNNGGGNNGGGTDKNFELNLMHVNDIHANTDKAPKLATAVKEVRTVKPDALLLNAGDVFSGTLYFNEFLGQADLAFMNLMKVDAMTFGNHEFDLGSSAEGHKALVDFIKAADFPFVSSNVDFSQDSLFDGLFNTKISSSADNGNIYTGIVKEVKGEKVGIFGLTTAETADIASPGKITFSNYIEDAEKMVAEFEAMGVNKIVALTHIGFDDNAAMDNDQELAAKVDGIDVIVGGHSHTQLNTPVVVDKDETGAAKDKTIIVQAYQYSDYLGALDVEFDKNGVVIGHAGELIATKDKAEDAEAVELLKPYKEKIEAVNNEEIGVTLDKALLSPRTSDEGYVPGTSVRASETILGNLITDGMLAKAQEYVKDKNVIMAFQNGGGIRAAIGAGPITVGEVITVLPFGNTLATMNVTGAELKEAFEISLKEYPKESGGFLHVSGAKVEFDSSKPAGQRVVSVAYKNEDGTYTEIEVAKTYTVATNAFTAKGGDGYDVLKKAYEDGRVTDLGLSDWENLREHLQSIKTIPAEIEGRIVDVKGEVVEPEPEIVEDPGTTPAPVTTTEPPLYNSNPEKLAVSQIARYDSGQGETGTEILAYDVATNKGFVTNGAVGGFDILNFADVKSGEFKQLDSTKRVVVEDYGIPGVKNITSIASNPTKDLIAIAAYAEKTDPGYIIFATKEGKYVKHVEVGALPDMVTFTPDGKKAIVANEGEPNKNTTIDPKGSISVIDIATLTATTLSFTEDMLDNNVRTSYKGASIIEQLEPEYVTVSADSKTAFVTLQENNAIATVNLETNTILHVKGLGVIDHSVEGNEMDANKDDKKAGILKQPILTYHMPDAIDTFTVAGKTYIITPNEGDSRDYADDGGYSEVSELADLTLPISLKEANYKGFTQAELNAFDLSTLKGYKVTTENGLNKAGTEYEAIYGYGGRSFSIFDASTMEQVYDSGSEFEKIIADKTPQYFNTNSDEIKVDNRSDDKGPEPETAVVGEIDGTTYGFIALERYSGIMVYDLTDVNAPEFVTLISSRDFTANAAGDVSPEGLQFIPASESPTGKAILAATHEVSGTIAVYEFGAGVEGDRTIDAENFSGTIEAPKTYEGNISVSITDATKLENAVIKGNLIITGTPTETFSMTNITVEGNLDATKFEGNNFDFDGITVSGEIIL